MLALIAAKEAATAPGLGTALVPAIRAGTLDSFALGMLLSGAVFLVFMAQRHGTRRAVGRAAGRFAGARLRIGAPRLPGRRLGEYPGLRRRARLTDPLGDEAGEFLLPAGVPGNERETADETGQSRRPAGYRSKHRLSGPEDGQPWPESRRRVPRHAAPSSALATRLAVLMQVKALVAGD